MPLAFLFIGAVFLIAAIRGTVSDSAPNKGDGLASLLMADLNPSNTPSFGPWLFALILIGALGFVPGLKPISWAFLVLVFVVIALTDNSSSNPGGGFLSNLESVLHVGGSATASSENSLGLNLLGTFNQAFSPGSSAPQSLAAG